MKTKKYKYLAIGDSISQGFNSKIGCGTAGYKTSKEFVKGYSYADYFMEFYLDYISKRYNDNWEEYWQNIEMENISASTLRISDLNSLVDSKLNLSVLNVAEINNELYKRSNLDLKQEFWEHNHNLDENEQFRELSKKFIAKIKEANFLSISIGGNEFQSSYPFIKFRNLVLEKNLYKQKEIKLDILNHLKTLTLRTEQELDKFIKNVKIINSELKIALVTYTPPFLHYYLSYEKFLRFKNPEIYNDFFKKNLGIFEKIFENVAQKNECILVKSFNYKQWFKNSRVFAENMIDVHPTELGYQEMAKKLFVAFLENQCQFKDYDKKMLKKLKKFSISYSKKITKRNKHKINRNLFLFEKRVNRIVNILSVWCNQKNDVQNPYFALLKTNIQESKNTIVKREQYASLYTILSEQMIFILDFFDNKSERYLFFKNKFITNNNILKFLVSILESEAVLKFLLLAEQESARKPKIAITKYIENVLNKNRAAIYEIFLEIINKDVYFYNLLSSFLEAILKDWKNGYFFNKLSDTVSQIAKEIFKDKKLIEEIKLIGINFLSYIKEKREIQKVSKFFKIFLKSQFEHLENIIELFLYNIYLIFKDDEKNAVNTILEILKIKASSLKYKNWRTLEKIVAKILKNITKKSFVKFLATLVIQTIINLNSKINLRKSYKQVFWIKVAKSFFRQIIKHPFNKNAYILIFILIKLAKLKIKLSLKIFDK
ncbi:SGNH/GDSL hydrolase family protein [Metamycoplasma phocicerebrale]|uniref:SGNH/GDSL hydrolase family protein n=1 Tax=Metamycoplasma phocicerebrale TaxID=142649 RepID=A0A3T0TT92_9BACT|nr:SGNH/GDSL hydrolase family protein [Metamycoplasma phocicerebrale]AZZ65305.1 SGNH/GDSL hydrolase family protein [Metamycoplasma phocicerebrale]